MLIKPSELPTRVVPAKTIRVQHLNCVEVRLKLDFGVQLDRKIVIESIEPNMIPPKLRHKAKKAMVVLVGGKHLFVHTGDVTTQDGYIKGRVYLNEKTYDAPPGTLMRPFGFDDRELVEIGALFQWMRTHEFDIGALKEVLNGTRRGGE